MPPVDNETLVIVDHISSILTLLSTVGGVVLFIYRKTIVPNAAAAISKIFGKGTFYILSHDLTLTVLDKEGKRVSYHNKRRMKILRNFVTYFDQRIGGAPTGYDVLDLKVRIDEGLVPDKVVVDGRRVSGVEEDINGSEKRYRIALANAKKGRVFDADLQCVITNSFTEKTEHWVYHPHYDTAEFRLKVVAPPGVKFQKAWAEDTSDNLKKNTRAKKGTENGCEYIVFCETNIKYGKKIKYLWDWTL